MTEYSIREATPEDARAIRRVGETSWRSAYGEILDEETIDAAIAEWYDLESVREYVTQDDVAYFVAEGSEAPTESGVVGYVSGGPTEEDDVAVLAAIYVHPDCWSDGIGGALLDRFEAFCLARDYAAIRLRVLAGNEIGRSFYRKHGFETVEERENDLFGEKIDELVLRSDLD